MILILILNLIFNVIFISIIKYIIIKNNKLSSEVHVHKPKQLALNQNNNKKDNNEKVNYRERNEKDNNEKDNKKKLNYDYDKCMKCIKTNLGKSSDKIRNCPECGKGYYDTGCIPSIIQKGNPTNCISKNKFTRDEAYNACVFVSNANQSCNLIDIDDKKNDKSLSYMKDECGENSYYCAYDESDSCSYKLCRLGDKNLSSSSSSICNCEPSISATDIMGSGWGRECIKGNKCKEYYPLRKAPELWTNSDLTRFYQGYGTFMDVPNLNTKISVMLDDAQVI